MAAKGFGGALICDAGGAEQDGNDPVPHGPTFFSSEWRELYKHALREADRAGAGNEPEYPERLEPRRADGPGRGRAEEAGLVRTAGHRSGTNRAALPEAQHRPEFYRDVAVVAYPVKPDAAPNKVPVTVSSSSARPDHPASQASDGTAETFWVSAEWQRAKAPLASGPNGCNSALPNPSRVVGFTVQGRPGYGPTEGELLASDDGTTWSNVQAFAVKDARQPSARFDSVRASHFRLVFYNAADPRFPQSPRNVQVAEVQLVGADGMAVNVAASRHRPIQMWAQKALHKALSFSAPDTTPLLQELPAELGEEDTRSADVIELTAQMDSAGTLRWDAPAGEWEILRFGCTLNDHCRVSTCSDGWQGYALDPFDKSAFAAYWQQVVEPLIADAGPLAGTALKYLHTDSWEVEVANWTPTLREEFRARRGYELVPFLPVIAGRIVDSRPVSNRFLHDFRKTMGDLAVDNHYRPFSEVGSSAWSAAASRIRRPARGARRFAALLGHERRADVRVLGLVVAAPHRRHEPLLRQAARFRRTHVRPAARAGRRIHDDRSALAGDAVGQSQAGVRSGGLRGLEPSGVACLRLFAGRDGIARPSSILPARTSIRTRRGGRSRARSWPT